MVRFGTYYKDYTMSYISNTNLDHAQISLDAGARVRTSNLTTLGDYKILGYDRTLLMENSGSGTGLYADNKYNMAVTGSGGYFIKQSKKFHQYFSGKSQIVECTFDNFQSETGVTKRVGYFSSDATAPFSSSFDGFYLENDGTNLKLIAQRNGVTTLNLSSSQWSGYSNIQNVDWSKFNVVLFDFLWLGGAVLRMWVKGSSDFELAHVFNYAGTSTDTFIKSPSQPLRYEVRSNSASASGSFRYICSQVATEGSINESGVTRGVDTTSSPINIAAIGTTYPIIAVRKSTAYRDVPVMIETVGMYPTSNADVILWSLQVNPTLSAGLTYLPVSSSAFEQANGNGTITVTTPGAILASGVVVQGSILPGDRLEDNYMAWLGSTLNNTMDQYVLCATPITATIAVHGFMSLKEF